MQIRALLPWLMVFSAGLCLRTGISSLSPVLEHIRSELGIGRAALGFLTAIPVICMGVLSPIGHVFEQRFGLRRSVIFGILILTLGMVLRLDAESYGLLLFTAALVGIGDAVIRPLLSGFIKDTFHNQTHAAMGVYATSMGVGSAAAAYVTPLLSGRACTEWRMGLAFWAIPAVIAALIWIFWQGHVQETVERKLEDEKSVSPFIMIWLTLFFGLQAGVAYSMIAWLPSLYVGAGYHTRTGGFWIAVALLLQTLTSLCFPIIIRLLRVIRIGLMGVTLLFVLLTLAGSIALWDLSKITWAAAVFLGIGGGGLFPVALLLPLEFTSSGSAATKLSGITQTGGYLLGGAIPWIAGLAADSFGVMRGVATLLFSVALLLMVVFQFIRVSFRARYRDTKIRGEQ